MSRTMRLAAASIAAGVAITPTAAEAAPRLEPIGVEAGKSELRRGTEALEARLERAKRERRPERARGAAPTEVGFGLAPGVPQEALDAIAACESGGDPTAVDSSGTYYGKYQFDIGTWASVGGSGNPAAASAAEQDYRASLLYSRAGSSPWPACGG